ncbi:YtjB family periplasmic protein [Shewanella fidelis]|uniref:AhpA/YtjB family protein n=1 Tax=Shewanella fidelis TaxID=173509 RepID=A0AAW8NKK5_9GAMM|nr:AhpA/YtjB family protein [Shewanella fidelis]MDR8522920.1 AhpA/YtjB family protein [Shewanella fidelis]MDW4811754.1 AhpA/YtjB family protein [Shewanella fidelis]MDW4815875.1 AhpA/YtjB family protein [Shewanella fidelis]MDW4819965.1 AhpA/YtjB family protein [Shewanella fidelis]MDW4824061.1 AhpA/YtjB family protein [Shewanella fidelis]
MFYLKGLRKSHRISRLLQIMIAIALFIGLDQLWETSLLQGQQLLKSQTEKMARLLVQQTAYGAAPALQLENDEQLQWLAQALVLDPKVMSASIFSEDGVRLSFAQSVTDEDLEPGSEELNTILEQYPPYVEAVSQDGKNLGYVEVRLEPKYFFNEIKEAHQINMEQQQMMLLIAGLIGMLLSRALSFKRADFDRRKARVKLRRLLAKKKEKAAAKEAKKLSVQGNTQASAKQMDEAKPVEVANADKNLEQVKASSDKTELAAEDKAQITAKAAVTSNVTSEKVAVSVETEAVINAQQGAVSKLEPAHAEASATDTKPQHEASAPKPKTKRAPRAKAAKTAATKATTTKAASTKAASAKSTVSKSTSAKTATPAAVTKVKRAAKTSESDIPEGSANPSASPEASAESTASEKVKPASAKKASVKKPATKKSPVNKATKAKTKVKPADTNPED